MKAILNNWSVMRGLRLLIGIIALVQSFIQKDITLSIIAGFLLVTAIANVGCCGGNGCAVNFSNRKKEKEIVYEELDNKQ
ncbi:MAG: hypothetical protein EOO53_19845 [Gammaproteobacteria bacterium]|nr:MAG: hypothetical protein EOO53_19845 [Gammaproteobacteria bacterium]